MRKIYSLILSVLALGGLAACQQEPVIEELDLARCLEPTNVTAIVRNGEYINFNWDKSKTAEAFEVELYTNEALEGEPAITLTIPKEDLPYLAHVEADVTYWFRARAISSTKDPSKWYVHANPLETSAIKSSLSPELVDRTATSISISWTKDDEVDHIRVTPSVDGQGEYTRFDVSAEEVAAAAKEMTGLKPSTQYSLTVHFKSAERGTVAAWTLPDLTGATKVTNIDELKQALADGAAKIEVAYSETPYDFGDESAKLVSSVAIYGDETPEGNRPVMIGHFDLDPSVEAVTSLHFENMVFSGNLSEKHTHAITTSKAGTVSDISYLRCEITEFLRGMLYDNYGLTASSISYDNVSFTNIAGDGGDGFDFRQSCEIGSVKFSNCTFSDGFRTVVRIDANPKLESFEFSNNTVNNVCSVVSSNNNGVLHIRAKKKDGTDPAIILKKNLFLNCIYGDASATNRGGLIGSNSADKLPTEVSKNFFYNCAESFFIHPVSSVEQLGKDACIANGGEILTSDPCVNSEGGNFYVMNESVLAAQAGAERWLSGYVEEPEDLTLAVTTPVKTWTLSDTKTFGKEAKKDMVRDGIRFYVKDKAVTIGSNGFTFNAAATVAGGVPSDGGLGILVDRPGGLVVSTLANGDDGAFLAVSLNGTVKAGLPVGTTNNKVVFADIEENSETMIYIYPTAPIILSGLQWTDDIETGGSTVLDAPVLAIDKTEVGQGEEATVTVSWDAINKAGSYDVTFNGSTNNVTATSYAIATKALAVGDYTVSVVAKPAADDLVREPSAAAEVSFTVKEVLKKLSATTPKEWGLDYMTAGVTKFGNGTELTQNMVYGNLGFVAGGGKFKFGIDNADTDPKYRVQVSGTGAAGTKCSLQFIAGGPGTLTIKARSSGTETRALAVAIGSTDVAQIDAPVSTDEPTTLTYTVNAAAGDLVNIYSKYKGINLYSITWTPDDSGGGSVVIDDTDCITTEYNADFSNATTFPTGDFTDVKTIEKVTYTAASDKKMTFETGAGRVKFNGGSTVGEDGIPVNRSISFKVVSPGTITHKIISGSSSDASRMATVILVTVTADGKKVTKLYEGACPTASSAAAVTTEITATHLEGITEAAVVYIYVGAAVNCYNLGFKPAQ